MEGIKKVMYAQCTNIDTHIDIHTLADYCRPQTNRFILRQIVWQRQQSGSMYVCMYVCMYICMYGNGQRAIMAPNQLMPS